MVQFSFVGTAKEVHLHFFLAFNYVFLPSLVHGEGWTCRRVWAGLQWSWGAWDVSRDEELSEPWTLACVWALALSLMGQQLEKYSIQPIYGHELCFSARFGMSASPAPGNAFLSSKSLFLAAQDELPMFFQCCCKYSLLPGLRWGGLQQWVK